jgi:hypothetical protein
VFKRELFPEPAIIQTIELRAWRILPSGRHPWWNWRRPSMADPLSILRQEHLERCCDGWFA